jgi:threonine dehydratase
MVRGTLDIEGYRKKVESAHKIVRKWAHNTPILKSTAINSLVGCEVFFKCENFQKIGAFKMRGAVNAVMSYDKTKKDKGFVTHSSGNHAQAVALSSQIAKTKAHIVMPKNAPQIKISAVKGYGASVYLCENNEQSRVETCEKIIKKTEANFIHPYDNEQVICGQATCAKEIFEELIGVNYIMCPVGGGGLASGTIISTRLYSPQTKVVLSEPLNASDAHESFVKKKLIPVDNPNTIADGLKTSLAKRTFDIILNGAEKIITVSEAEIIFAMKLIWERMKIVCEPSCAVPLAALIKEKNNFSNKKIAIILTGGNVDVKALPF